MRAGKIAADEVLWQFVAERLEKRWSPEQICQALRREFPDDAARWNCAPILKSVSAKRSVRQIGLPQPGSAQPPGRIVERHYVEVMPAYFRIKGSWISAQPASGRL